MMDSIYYATSMDVIFCKECRGHYLCSSAAISANWFVLQLPNNGSLIKTRQSIIIPRRSAFIYLRSRNRPISALQAVSAGQCDMPSNQTLPLDHTSATASHRSMSFHSPPARTETVHYKRHSKNNALESQDSGKTGYVDVGYSKMATYRLVV